jgi:hypothetical protein
MPKKPIFHAATPNGVRLNVGLHTLYWNRHYLYSVSTKY